MLILGGSKLEQLVARAVLEANTRVEKQVHETMVDSDRVAKLKEQISTLTIERDKKIEEFSRREREIEHKIGLERKRQEFEITQSKREATVEVREANLAADKDRFANEMKFQREHLESEVKSLRDLTAQLLERLPTAEIFANLGGGKKKE